VYRVLSGKHEGKRPFGRRGHGWEYNIMYRKGLEGHNEDLNGLYSSPNIFRVIK